MNHLIDARSWCRMLVFSISPLIYLINVFVESERSGSTWRLLRTKYTRLTVGSFDSMFCSICQRFSTVICTWPLLFLSLVSSFFPLSLVDSMKTCASDASLCC
ncbi:hypothetical protein B0J11DRAFT_3546 [Dendryphion nanum]|uniref:Uncharacterized protein n=1 Tax=Dendryphion nanum TaxID=256645 RepID=A0A9P9EJ61_9PLEO|nr:hypothetical protein B0J11DRAFT_3546 [Dendryphion nanum]